MGLNTGGDGSDSTRLARLLFSDLAGELDRALGQSVNGSRQAVELGALAHADRLLDEAARKLGVGELGRAAFEGFASAQADRLERAFANARTVASWAGVDLPAPEAFWGGGVDRAVFTSALRADPTLQPVPAPYGLGEARWVAALRAAARMPGSPLSLGSPLAIAPEVSAAFTELDSVPRNVRAVADSVRWTLRLIPAGPFPSRTDVSHLFGPHPSLPEMLMLQLMRLAEGEEPVDRHSFTWLDGTFAGGRFAARHFFDTSAGSVGVNAREVGNQGPHLGTRAPVGS